MKIDYLHIHYNRLYYNKTKGKEPQSGMVKHYDKRKRN